MSAGVFGYAYQELHDHKIMEERMKKQGKTVCSDLDINHRIYLKGLLTNKKDRMTGSEGADELFDLISLIAQCSNLWLGINCLLDKIQDPQPETSHPQPETTPA